MLVQSSTRVIVNCLSRPLCTCGAHVIPMLATIRSICSDNASAEGPAAFKTCFGHLHVLAAVA